MAGIRRQNREARGEAAPVRLSTRRFYLEALGAWPNPATRQDPGGRPELVPIMNFRLGLTGTYVGCEHGVCGARTVVADRNAVRRCLMFAVQADNTEITMVEVWRKVVHCQRYSGPSASTTPRCAASVFREC